MLVKFTLVTPTEDAMREKVRTLKESLAEHGADLQPQYFFNSFVKCEWEGKEEYRARLECKKPKTITKNQLCTLVNAVQVVHFTFS